MTAVEARKIAEALVSIARSLDVLAYAKIIEVESAFTNGPTAHEKRKRLREKAGLPPFENLPLPSDDRKVF